MHQVLGVVRMAKSRSAWRALRPALLAGAATLTWLTFSSPAASADVLSETTSLLGGVTSSVPAGPDRLSGLAPAAPSSAAPAPAAVAPGAVAPAVGAPVKGLLQPVVGEVSGLADDIVAVVPVVNQVLPAGGVVTAVTAPVAGVADGATTSLVDVVVPPVAEAVPVLEPVLEPVADLVTGDAPLPVAVPELPVPVVADPSGGTGVSDPADLPDGAGLPDAGLSGVSDLSGAPVPSVDRGVAGGAAVSGAAAPDGVPVLDAVPGAGGAGSPAGAGLAGALPLWDPAGADAGAGGQDVADPSPVPAQAPVPAVPGSGAGSGTPTSGSSGSAGWLSPFSFDLPVPGALRAGDIAAHVPAPVSFDPGSSPD